MRLNRALAVGLVAVLPVCTPVRAFAQAELDRIVARVKDRIITQSDVRQATFLKLVDDTSSDDATRRCLEDRMLMLAEIALQPALPPGPEGDLAARRTAWEASLGGRGRVSELLAKTSLGENGLDAWFRDDLRIQAHLKRQFGGVPEADRSKAVSDWVARLRQRAGLK